MTELQTWRLGTPSSWAENWSGPTTDLLPASFGSLAFQKTQCIYHNSTGPVLSKIYPDEHAAGPLPARSISWTYKAEVFLADCQCQRAT